MVEDVTTTGGSAMQAVEALREEGANIVLVLTIVDRLEGAAEKFAAEKLAFRALYTADEFLSLISQRFCLSSRAARRELAFSCALI